MQNPVSMQIKFDDEREYKEAVCVIARGSEGWYVMPWEVPLSTPRYDNRRKRKENIKRQTPRK